jgi:hypothetical protein
MSSPLCGGQKPGKSRVNSRPKGKHEQEATLKKMADPPCMNDIRVRNTPVPVRRELPVCNKPEACPCFRWYRKSERRQTPIVLIQIMSLRRISSLSTPAFALRS